MTVALVIGGTGFVGRHTVEDLREHGYDVTSMSRGHIDVESTDSGVEHVTGDRTHREVLADVARRVDPDVVIDCAAFHPEDVRTATDVFASVDAYVYVSSGSVYSVQNIPKREDETPLHGCTPEQADDDSMATYPSRKAEGDRQALAAAERGHQTTSDWQSERTRSDDSVAATSVRPTAVYGPQTTRSHDTLSSVEPPSWADGAPVQTRHDYWVDRVNRYDRVVVPGDGTAIWHQAYVEDVASALRVVAERGDPGEAYNAGDRRVCTLDDTIELLAEALDTEVKVVHASRRELAVAGLEPGDFPLYHHPATGYPHVLSTAKLAALDWTSTPVEVALERIAAESMASGRDGSEHGPSRDAEERLLESLAG